MNETLEYIINSDLCNKGFIIDMIKNVPDNHFTSHKNYKKIIHNLEILDQFIIFFDNNFKLIDTMTLKYIILEITKCEEFSKLLYTSKKVHNNKHIDFFIEEFEKIILHNFVLNAEYLSKMSDDINCFVMENDIYFINLHNKKIRAKLFTLLKYMTMCNYKSIEIASLFTCIDDYVYDYIKEHYESQNIDVETLNSIQNTTTICYKVQWQGIIQNYHNKYSLIEHIINFSN